MGTDKVRKVKDKLATDKDFAGQCYQACTDFLDYVAVLQAKGLAIADVGHDLLPASLDMGSRYQLLATDALHVATCQTYGLKHIATNDSHFDRVDILHVWKP